MSEPKLHHPEVRQLYHTSLSVDETTLDAILGLPRDTLIADLEAILASSADRYEHIFEMLEPDTEYFPLHAIFLLTEIKAVESLPALLDFLSLEHELLDFYLGDYLTEIIWESMFILGGDQLDTLKSFVRDRDVNLFARSAASSAVAQLALHQPDRRNEVVKWYQDVFETLLNSPEDELLRCRINFPDDL